MSFDASNYPYQTPPNQSQATPVLTDIPPGQPRRVSIQIFGLFQRAIRMLEGEYLRMVGYCLVVMLLNSVVPFGLISGPLLIGLYLCFSYRTRGIPWDFNTLFKGFDQFGQALLAWLIIFLVAIGIMVAAVIGMFIVGFLLVLITDGSEEVGIAAFIVGYVIFILLTIFVYVPFLFVFQLMAETSVNAGDACKLSWKAVRMNLFGITLYSIITALIVCIGTLLCFLPGLFALPMIFGSAFILYRDIFGAPAAGGTSVSS